MRGEITASLGRASFIGNSVLRVLADATAGLTHLTLRYIDWVALQLMPDTAEQEWLDRHGDIWLVNADSTLGRKEGALASGTVTVTGIAGTVIPASTRLTGGDDWPYETTVEATTDDTGVPVAVRALNFGTGGNREVGDVLNFETAISGVDGNAPVVLVDGGVDSETDEQLRARVLRRIRQPPMGGAAYDYEAWALAVPGVTRAWAAAEQGPGTVTVRFLMDDLRASDDGWPTSADVITVKNYIDLKRPVAVKDSYVFGPIKQIIDVEVENLNPNNAETQAEIEKSLQEMMFERAAPGQTIYAAWISEAIFSAPNVVSFTLVTTDDNVMPSLGHMGVLGTLLFNAMDDPLT